MPLRSSCGSVCPFSPGGKTVTDLTLTEFEGCKDPSAFREALRDEHMKMLGPCHPPIGDDKEEGGKPPSETRVPVRRAEEGCPP